MDGEAVTTNLIDGLVRDALGLDKTAFTPEEPFPQAPAGGAQQPQGARSRLQARRSGLPYQPNGGQQPNAWQQPQGGAPQQPSSQWTNMATQHKQWAAQQQDRARAAYTAGHIGREEFQHHMNSIQEKQQQFSTRYQEAMNTAKPNVQDGRQQPSGGSGFNALNPMTWFGGGGAQQGAAQPAAAGTQPSKAVGDNKWGGDDDAGSPAQPAAPAKPAPQFSMFDPVGSARAMAEHAKSQPQPSAEQQQAGWSQATKNLNPANWQMFNPSQWGKTSDTEQPMTLIDQLVLEACGEKQAVRAPTVPGGKPAQAPPLPTSGMASNLLPRKGQVFPHIPGLPVPPPPSSVSGGNNTLLALGQMGSGPPPVPPSSLGNRRSATLAGAAEAGAGTGIPGKGSQPPPVPPPLPAPRGKPPLVDVTHRRESLSPGLGTLLGVGGGLGVGALGTGLAMSGGQPAAKEEPKPEPKKEEPKPAPDPRAADRTGSNPYQSQYGDHVPYAGREPGMGWDRPALNLDALNKQIAAERNKQGAWLDALALEAAR